MAEYKVNLPKTNFPMRAGLPKREPGILEFWQKMDLYQSFAKPKNSRGKFIVHDGPPYANGDIHIGHALNKTLKDIINKSKLLHGLSVPYIPGWDCHGLPVEINVEKKFGKPGVDLPLEKFIDKSREYASSQIELQIKSFKRLGVVADWENYYSTMDFKYEANIVRALGDIVDAKYVIRGYKPVHWCVSCGSALAEAEVEYKDKASPAIDVRFRMSSPHVSGGGPESNISIPIWTTTPWTLPANEAVSVHPKLKYVLVDCKTLGERFIVAEDLLENVMERFGENNYEAEKEYVGSELEGLELKHPFLSDKTVPVILGEHVTTDVGTGAVHTAPAHGQDDYKIGLQYKLSINNPVGSDGKFLDSTEFFAGMSVFKANDNVVEKLKEKGALIHAEELQHSYPHCWRHKTPLIFRATRQWFVGMDNRNDCRPALREQAQYEIEKVNWMPEQGKNSIKSMVDMRPDWCISRQRTWGVPITLFVHKETGEIYNKMPDLIRDVIAPNIEKEGVIYWRNLDPIKFLEEHARDIKAQDYEKVNDTLDVWFDSGVSHYCIVKARSELQFPADLYIEGVDQYRGWFQSSLLTAVALYGHAPYKTVLSHGFTVDDKGHKMSKSRGNVISPQKIIDKYGADILRLWVASSYLYDDIAVSEEILARTVDIYRTVRNTARFLLGNIFDFDPEKDLVDANEMLSLDRFAVNQALNLAKNVQKYYDLYQFQHVSSDMQKLLTNEISSFYFSVIKDRLYTMNVESFGRRSAQTALFYILEILVRLIAPILSFTAEEIWQEMRAMKISSRENSVFMSRWDEIVDAKDFDLAKDEIGLDDWSDIQKLRDAVNKELEKLRANGTIGSSLEAEVVLYGDEKVSPLLGKLKDDLRFVLITSAADVGDIASLPKDVITTEILGLKLVVKKSSHKKCSRCWHYREDIGENKEHPELCGRCVSNLFSDGEARSSA